MKIIAISHRMKRGVLDDDYTLFENGEVLHEYDKNIYPGCYNLKEALTVEQLAEDVKKSILVAASDENKELVRKVLFGPTTRAKPD